LGKLSVLAGEHLTLTSADGTEFSAYLARAEGPTGVVVLPDVRGLFRFYEQLAERFAAAGHPAIAFDYFGRTAGLGPRDEDFEYMPHVQQTRPETVAQDVAAALEALSAERAITVGFCFGGAQSFMQAAEGHAGLAGVVGFYGSLRREGQRWTLDRAGEMKLPLLGLFAGADQNITLDQVQAFDEALKVEHEIHVYDGAPHSFFDRRQEQYADESKDAWERILGFIAQLEATV
jgi:carboxymethylenebutenolidase